MLVLLVKTTYYAHTHAHICIYIYIYIYLFIYLFVYIYIYDTERFILYMLLQGCRTSGLAGSRACRPCFPVASSDMQSAMAFKGSLFGSPKSHAPTSMEDDVGMKRLPIPKQGTYLQLRCNKGQAPNPATRGDPRMKQKAFRRQQVQLTK